MLPEKLISFLRSFVDQNFTGETSQFATVAFSALSRLFAKWELTPLSDSAKPSGKGGKSVSHNTDETGHIRVARKDLSCPLVVKPIVSDKVLLGYEVVSDSNRVSSIDEMVSFLEVFEGKVIKKHDDANKAIASLASRESGKDRTNNARQRLLRQAEIARTNAEKLQIFKELPDATWQSVRPGLVLIDEDFVEMVDDARTTVS